MPFVFKRLALFMSIAAAFAADKPPFKAPPLSAFAHKQTNDGITIAAEAYTGGEKMKAAFGKLDPNVYGVLPVLVVIQNDGKESIRLDRLKVEYVAPKARVEATPARDVRYARGVQRPNVTGGPPGLPPLVRGKKNPLDAWEIDGRAFSAQMLPPGQTASGFFYFRIDSEPKASVYINGLVEARSGKELFYFEVPLD
jgi:hypothetical protein